jgi:hypothetical protein
VAVECVVGVMDVVEEEVVVVTVAVVVWQTGQWQW